MSINLPIRNRTNLAAYDPTRQFVHNISLSTFATPSEFHRQWFCQDKNLIPAFLFRISLHLLDVSVNIESHIYTYVKEMQ